MISSIRAWALSLLISLLPAAAWAAEVKLFVQDKGVSASYDLAQLGWVKRYAWIRLAPDAAAYLSADATTSTDASIQLFDDTLFVLREQSRQITAQGATTIRYTLYNDPQGGAVFSATQDSLVGTITTGDHRVYRVMPAGGGLHRAEELDHSKFPDCADHSPDSLALADSITSAAPASPAGSAPQIDSGTQINVMVVYTPSVLSSLGGNPSAVQSLIATAISETNSGYSTSGVNTALNLVHTAQVSYDESAGFEAALNAVTGTSDGQMDEVHALRNTYAADLVVLLINNTQYCGMAWLPSTVSTSNQTLGFSVTAYNCATGYYSFGHEIGHNMGARHDRYVDGGSTPYAHGHGYVNKTAKIRSIMAYNNDCYDSGYNCTRVNHWSAADRMYNGSSVIGDSINRNNDALNASAYTIANYRTSASPYTLGVSKAGTGTGTVTSTPSGINCGSDCSESYGSATQVTLNAAPSAGHHFAGWGGSCSAAGLALTCSVSVSGNIQVSATFGQGIVVPQPPVGVGVAAGPGSATLVFTASPNNGGSAITSYTATCTAAGYPSRSATGSTSPLVVSGLVAGVSYSCSVVASNATGTSQASAVVTVTPKKAVADITPILMLLLD